MTWAIARFVMGLTAVVPGLGLRICVMATVGCMFSGTRTAQLMKTARLVASSTSAVLAHSHIPRKFKTILEGEPKVSNLTRIGSGLSIPDGFTRTESRELARAQNQEIARGQVAAVRAQAAGFVTAVSVQVVGLVSREAAFQADGDPEIANRTNHIVDQLTVMLGNEIGRFGMGRYLP
ncbi:hypothetical protein [Mycobacteroides abscessus]|uniref:hypothetical protein n=1 Tax=Mycobacteroides abscessus TaxID=36809 RepID=UPI001F415807|nr:hypothetical protein [Mycobacteroides abscessus]